MPPAHLRPFTKEIGDIYKLILEFLGQPSAPDPTIGAINRTRAFISSFDGYKCARVYILQNWPNLVKYEFVDLHVSFPMTLRSLQLEFYNSIYGRFGGTHRV